MENPDKPLSTLYRLLKEFIERQQLVVQVMEAIRPDLLNGFPGKELRPRPSKPYIANTQRGFWHSETEGEWEYYVHGAGCRLVNKVTGEPIEWNNPITWTSSNISNFDPYWFVNWLIWKLEQIIEDAEYRNDSELLKAHLGHTLDETRSIVFKLLSELATRGLLIYHPDRTDMYALIEY